MFTSEDLAKANATIKGTDIQGKEYAEVNQRIKAFRLICPNGSILTDFISNENGVAIFKATIMDEEGHILGTGTAYEKEGAGFINKTSYIENCETSAVGRALGMCGIGVEKSLASYEEVANAKEQQKQKPKGKTKEQKQDDVAVEEAKLKAEVLKYVNDANLSPEVIEKQCKFFKVESLQQLTAEQCKKYLASVNKNKEANADE